jgi:thioredoxin reductase (NADPH)
MSKEIIHKEVVILGSGPAGLTAAIYAGRANLTPLVIEGPEPGGQLMITTDVENYPGFANGILGPELMEQFREQAKRFGTEFLMSWVTKADLSQRPFRLQTDDHEVKAATVIIASGASAKWLGIPGEAPTPQGFGGNGVSACATCDGFFFKGRPLVVVGGGDTAMEEATFLTKFATGVTVIHRRDTLRASKIMQDKAFRNEKIDFIWDTAVEEILGTKETGVTGVRLRNLKTRKNGCFPPKVFLLRSVISQIRICSGVSWIWTKWVTSKPGNALRPRTFLECLHAAMRRTRSIGKQLPRRAPDVWPQ